MSNDDNKPVTAPFAQEGEPTLYGFGASFLLQLDEVVHSWNLTSQDVISKLTPSVEERAAILRQRAADMTAQAEALERGPDDGKPTWGSKWKS